MYLENERLVYFMANNLHVAQTDIEYEDVVSEGKLALWKAVTTFKTKMGSFSTYACNVIKNQMLVYLNSKGTRDGRLFRDNGASLDETIDDEGKNVLSDIISSKAETDVAMKIYLDNLRKTEKAKSVQIFFDYFDGMTAKELNEKYGLKGKMYCRYLALGRDILQARIKRDLKIERI